MRFLADENVALSVVKALRKAGHDVFDVKESGLRAAADSRLIKYAIEIHRY